MFTLDSYWALDGSVGGSGAEYINHCCDPNIHAWICQGHILYMAARDIQPGEELTIDYHFEPEVEKVVCRCGAAQCRGTINLKPEPKRFGASGRNSRGPKQASGSGRQPEPPRRATGRREEVADSHSLTVREFPRPRHF